MVDRVYKGSLPKIKRRLEEMRVEFGRLDTDVDWAKLRVEPMIRHVESLENSLATLESKHLTRGVVLLHSDLVYLRTNVRGLEEILQAEEKRVGRKLRSG